MSWADIKRKYAKGGTAATQSTEDMAARRILRAVGITESKLPAAEREAGLDVQADATLLERAEQLVNVYRGSRLSLNISRLPPVRDVRSVKEAEDIVLEMAEPLGRRADLVYHVRGGDNLMAVIRLGSLLVDTDNLPLPCRLTRSRDASAVLLWCDAGVFYSSVITVEAPNG